MFERLSKWIAIATIALVAGFAPALSADDDGKLKKEQIDQLVAPIALYPDDLLTNVLVGATYPLDVVQASRWRADPANAKLKGDALVKALEAKEWDPSIKALVQFPDVLKTMSDKLEWTQKLGDAFLAQQDDVMDEIQVLRRKADEAGHLESNKQQKVTKEGSSSEPIYIIQPASPQVVYVPTYQPAVVYGTWSYPSYPPYYWPPAGSALVNGFLWGTGIAIASNIWGWGNANWNNHDIDINVNKWNNINVNRDKLNSGKWEHRPERRGSVPYKGQAVRDKYQGANRAQGSKDFRGFDDARGNIDRSKIESKLKEGDRGAIKDKAGNAGANLKDKAGNGSGAKLKEKAGDGVAGRAKDSARELPKGGDRKVSGAKAKGPGPGAFDVKRGADVQRSSSRGHASREISGARGGGGGGGGRAGGGGGRGGGRR